MGDQLAKIIASTLTEQDPEHGLSDVQVAAFLAAFEQKASTASQGQPASAGCKLDGAFAC